MYQITMSSNNEWGIATPVNPTSNEFSNVRMSTNSNRSDWNCQAYYAFTDNTINHGWSSDDGSGHWIKWQYLDKPHKIEKYEVVTMYNNGQYGTTSWRLEGSNDDANWVTVDTRTNAGSYNVVEYVCNGSVGLYSYYRLISTSTNTHTYFNHIKGKYIDDVVKTSLGFNTITHRPLKFRVLEVGDISHLVMPTNGLVFYAPLHTDEIFDKTGKPLDFSNNFTTKNNIGCFRLGNSAYVSSNHLLLGATEFSASFLVNYESIASDNSYLICEYSKQDYWMFGSDINRYNDRKVYFYVRTKANGWNSSRIEYKLNQEIQLNKWYHFGFVYSPSYVKCYLNGVCINEYAGNTQLVDEHDDTYKFEIGGTTDSNSSIRYIHSVRIYDRALTQDEITLLSREFNSIWSCPRFSSDTREDSTWKVTCGSEYSDNFMCGKAFNGDFTYTRNKGWAGANNHPDEWILIQNKVKPVNVKKLYFLPTNDNTADGFNSFKLYGSNDNSSFTLLYESDEELRASNGGRYYTFNNNKKYSYYKLTFRCSSYIFIGQIAMFSDTSATIDTAYDYF